MKLLNASFKVENDLAEYNLRNTLDSLGAIHVNTLSDTDHLKDDSTFKRMCKSEKMAKKAKWDYINNNRP